jgi:hypothetical protein
MTNTPFSLDVSFAFIIPGQYRAIYAPYTPSDKYSYKRKQNFTIDEDIHQVLLIIAV